MNTDDIIEGIRQIVPENRIEDIRLIRKRTKTIGGPRWLFRLYVQDVGYAYVKVYRESGLAEKEANFIDKIGKQSDNDTIKTVKLIGFWTDGIVTKAAEGIPLFLWIRLYPGSTHIFHAIGSWLKKFHSQETNETLLRNEISDCSQIKSPFQSAMDSHSGFAWTLLPASIQNRIRKNISRAEGDGLISLDHPKGYIHGDFCLSNFIFEKNHDGVGHVFDFENVRLGLPEEDLAFFLAKLRLSQLVNRNWIHTVKMENALMEGYGHTKWPPHLIEVLILCYLLRIHKPLENSSGWREPIRQLKTIVRKQQWRRLVYSTCEQLEVNLGSVT